MHKEGDSTAAKLVTGEYKDMYGAMIAMQKNSISLSLMMAGIIDYCRPLEARRLIFNKLDWAVGIGPAINQAVVSNSPVTYLSDSSKVNDCKSALGINTGNVIDFRDPSEAMGRQFKPCRVCCSEMISQKPIEHLARGYAGRRYYQQ